MILKKSSRSIDKYVLIKVFLIIFIIAGSAQASTTTPATPSIPSPLSSSIDRVLSSQPGDLFVVLNNGLTVLLRRKTENDVVSAQVYVRAGSIHEGHNLKAGLSHYLEHVVSGGTTKSFTESQAKKRLQKIGGATNAFTSYDRTVYYIDTSSGHWKEALDLLLSYVSENTLNPKEVSREKAVIQQEIKMGENSLDRELWNLFIKTAYLQHPVRNPVIGYEPVFIRQTRDDLKRYYLERYQPDQIVVSVVGNLQPLEVLAFVHEKTRAFTRRTAAPLSLPQEPFQTGPRWTEQESSLARLHQVLLGFPSVSLHNPDMYALDVLSFLLGEGQTSRLYQRVKERENQVLRVGSSNWTPSFIHGQFSISLTMPSQNWPGVLTSVEEEIERFKSTLVSDEELEKAKKTAIAQHVFGKETASSMASSLASSYFDTGDPYFDETYVKGIHGVTADQIREAARTYLRKDRMNVAVVKPPPVEPGPAASEEKMELQAEAGEPAFHVLDNGLKIVLKRNASLPVVNIQLYGLGGLILEPPEQQGISALTASLLTSGTPSRTKLDIVSAVEEAGGSIGSRSDNNTYHVAVRLLKEDLSTGLNILADIVRNANFPKDEIEKKRSEFLLAIQKQQESWHYELMDLFKKSYFSNSPYERDRLGTEDTLKAIDRDHILSFYRRMVNPSHSVLAIYGDIDPESLLPQLAELFRPWNGQRIEIPEWPDETRPLSASRSVDKKTEKTSASVFVGTNGLDILSEKRPVLDVLDTLLAGTSYPGGRLFEALRGGKEDLVYLVGATPFYGIKAGFFGVISQTTLGNLEKVQKAIQGHLKKIMNEPVPAAELEIAKDMILTTHHLEQESLGAQAQNAAVNEVLGLGWDYEKRYPELIRKVTVQDVQSLARELFTHTLVTRTIPENPVEIMPAKASSPHSSTR